MNALFASAFALGLATSVHCVSMCGPMVVSYVASCSIEPGWRSKLAPNLAYQAAKIVSYMLVGIVLGAIGSAFNLDSLRPWVMVAAGAFMIILGLGMTGRVRWAARLTPRPPRALITALSRLRRKSKADAEAGQESIMIPVAFGLLTGLMPCAPLQAAQLVAASSGSALNGGLVMLAFGLGTAPLMLIFGTASSMIPKAWKHRMNLALAGIVIFSGLIFLNRAALLTGFPISTAAVASAISPSETTGAVPDYAVAADGSVEVPLVIESVQYYPQTLIIPAGQAVKLVVDRREANACSDRLVVPKLDIDVALAPNASTVIDIPATEPGTYHMTCGMGMMSGEIVVTVP